MGRSKALIGSIATPSQRRTIDRGTTPRLTSVGYTDRCREVVRFLPLRDSPGGAVRCGWRRLSDHNERGVGLSPVARNTIRDSRLKVVHSSRSTHWRLDHAVPRWR